jgi:hypothetical protein
MQEPVMSAFFYYFFFYFAVSYGGKISFRVDARITVYGVNTEKTYITWLYAARNRQVIASLENFTKIALPSSCTQTFKWISPCSSKPILTF